MSLYNTLRFIATHPLTRERKIGALLGYFKWQLGSRLVPGAVVYDWIDGTKIIVGPGGSALALNIYCGLREFADMAYVLHVIGPGDLFVDVGANVGSYTILACAARGATGYCIEPVPTTFERLMANLRINDLASRVTAFNVGLSDREGVLRFTGDEDCANHVVENGIECPGAIAVRVVPLDSILAGHDPSVIKIDVEGFETHVLAGAREALGRGSLHSVIIELNGSASRYGLNEGDIVATMVSYGFSRYTYDPFARELQRLAEKKEPSGNTLFVRDEERVRDRIQRSPLVAVAKVLL